MFFALCSTPVYRRVVRMRELSGFGKIKAAVDIAGLQHLKLLLHSLPHISAKYFGPEPQRFGPGPQASGSEPQAFGRRPQASGPEPQAFGRRPQASGPEPQASGRRPQRSGLGPKASGPGPKLFGAWAQKRRPAPERCACLCKVFIGKRFHRVFEYHRNVIYQAFYCLFCLIWRGIFGPKEFVNFNSKTLCQLYQRCRRHPAFSCFNVSNKICRYFYFLRQFYLGPSSETTIMLDIDTQNLS